VTDRNSRVAPFGARLALAARTLVRPLLLLLALASLAIPAGYSWTRFYPVVLAVPLFITTFYRSDRAFRLWAMYVIGFGVFVIARSLADDLGMPLQVSYPIVADQVIGFGRVPTVSLQVWAENHGARWWADPIAFLIYVSYFCVPPGLALALWIGRSPKLPRYVYTTLIVLGLAVVCHALVPTAPPWLAAEWGHLPEGARLTVEIWRANASADAARYAQTSAGNAVAAMPSLHFGLPWLLMLVAWSHRRLRWLAIAYVVMMGVALAYLGEHYVVDELGGAVLVGLAWWITTRSSVKPRAGRDAADIEPDERGQVMQDVASAV
jgi:hypothetical protein